MAKYGYAIAKGYSEVEYDMSKHEGWYQRDGLTYEPPVKYAE